MRASEFVKDFEGIDLSLEIQKDDEYVDDDDADNQTVYVTASRGGKELGHVLFTMSYDGQGLILNPQDLEVDPRFQGQGIAAVMYDYVKSRGYRIRRSGQQTDAGAAFWQKHRPGQNVWEDTEEYLYHATYGPLLKSIQAKGLGNTTQSQWTDSEPGVVYLARDPEVARSYAETADAVPEEWLDQIVVLQISQKDLDADRLGTDQNVQDNTGDTLEYHSL